MSRRSNNTDEVNEPIVDVEEVVSDEVESTSEEPEVSVAPTVCDIHCSKSQELSAGDFVRIKHGVSYCVNSGRRIPECFKGSTFVIDKFNINGTVTISVKNDNSVSLDVKISDIFKVQ